MPQSLSELSPLLLLLLLLLSVADADKTAPNKVIKLQKQTNQPDVNTKWTAPCAHPRSTEAEATLWNPESQSERESDRATAIWTLTGINVHVCAYVYACTHADMHTYRRADKQTCTYMHTCTHVDLHSCTHASIHTCKHAHMQTCTLADIHIYRHADMHTCVCHKRRAIESSTWQTTWQQSQSQPCPIKCHYATKLHELFNVPNLLLPHSSSAAAAFELTSLHLL